MVCLPVLVVCYGVHKFFMGKFLHRRSVTKSLCEGGFAAVNSFSLLL